MPSFEYPGAAGYAPSVIPTSYSQRLPTVSPRMLAKLLLIPFAIIALAAVTLPGLGDGPTPRADAIAGLVGSAYGLYAGIVLALFAVGRLKRR